MTCPSTLVASVTASAIALAEGRSAEEIALLASAFSLLGDTLETILLAKEKDRIFAERSAGETVVLNDLL